MRALISVYDKEGVVALAQGFVAQGIEIISSGGTYDLLKAQGIPVLSVFEVTQFQECLDGRVKTLHPKIHAGILANREIKAHLDTLTALDISLIDYVVVNLYPFAEVIKKENHTLAEAIENIDIGGPTLIRAAAKNHQSVMILTDKVDYQTALQKIKDKSVDNAFRYQLAVKAFAHTAAYDSMIFNYLNKQEITTEYPDTIVLTLKKKQALRYGENPHQSAAYYINEEADCNGIEHAVTLHGKELSYNNINDAQAAIALTMEFSEPACVVVKHATPCGVAIGNDVQQAFNKAHQSDPVSIFGGIVCVNRPINKATAEQLKEIFLEIVIAPAYEEDALVILKQKKNLRLLTLEALSHSEIKNSYEYKSVGGGFLVQQTDTILFANNHQVVTQSQPSVKQLTDLEFAMTVVKHVKSNAIVVAKEGQTLGIGGGDVSRISAAEAALHRAGEQAKGAVIASDAFFPYADVVEVCIKQGIKGIIQPGGSVNDQLSIDVCNQHAVPMIFTSIRHFKH